MPDLTKRTIFLFEFTPDGGKQWFPLCDKQGDRIWASRPTLPSAVVEWRTTLRFIRREYGFEVLPDKFEVGVWGVLHREEEDTKWAEHRSEIGVRFTANASGFTCLIQADPHKYLLKRHSCIGEPIWRLIADSMNWIQRTLHSIDGRGMIGRDCRVVVDGISTTTGEPDDAYLGTEFRLWDYMNGWMTTAGHKPWIEGA